ncbi:MAG: metallophosphoesterase [Clostridia bacterium]|nr:metallophosphoesterase [Clostridia bacterium]
MKAKRISALLLVVIIAIMSFSVSVSAESPEFEFSSDGKFTVLQISDPQDDMYPAYELDGFIRKAIETVNPDFIVLSGDIVEDSRAGDISDDKIFQEGVYVDGDYEKTLENVKTAVKHVFTPIEEAGIYYTIAQGNNDYKSGISNEDWLEIYASYPHCITVDMSNDEEGKIDSYVEIQKYSSEEIGYGIWALDNGRGFTEGQKEWFKNKDTGNVPSVVFEHIPTDDVGNLFEKCNIWDEGALSGDGGFYRLNKEIASGVNYVTYTAGTTDEFLMWKDKGVKGAFFGHIHTDGFTGTYNGITLGLTYGCQFSKAGPYGVREIVLSEDGSFETNLYVYENGGFSLQEYENYKTYDNKLTEVIAKMLNVIKFIFNQISSWLKF